MKYGCSQSAISELVNELSAYLDTTWGHLMLFDTDGLLTPKHFKMYADAAGAPLRWVWGFIDCTICSICHPTWLQRQQAL
jgi:hypothetical protein